MKVIFDFDDVIFDTKGFKVVMFDTLEKRGYHRGRVLYEEMRKEGKPFSLLSFIAKVTADSSEENVETIYDEMMNSCPRFVNSHVLEVMKQLGKEHCYIVTHGDARFQRDKIQRSVGKELVKEVVVVSGSKAEAIARFCKQHEDEEIIFVDDKLLFINDLPVSECTNLKTVIFNEHGLENLKAEIEASRVDEKKMGRVQEGEAKSEARYIEHTPDAHLPRSNPGMTGGLH